jgi:hypothetical protein
VAQGVGGDGQRALRGRLAVVPRVQLPGPVEVPGQVVVGVDEAGQDGRVREVVVHALGGATAACGRGTDRLDPLAADGDPDVAGAAAAAVQDDTGGDGDGSLVRLRGDGEGQRQQGDRARPDGRASQALTWCRHFV